MVFKQSFNISVNGPPGHVGLKDVAIYPAPEMKEPAPIDPSTGKWGFYRHLNRGVTMLYSIAMSCERYSFQPFQSSQSLLIV